MDKLIVSQFDSYCSDYPLFDKNWEFLCNKLGASKKKILLVQNIDFNQQTDENKMFDHLTKDGYCIRRVGEFTACTKCGKAVPCKEIWELLRSKHLPVPDTWAENCTTC